MGFTTDPRRRLRQHNGDILGGARKTSKDKNRPWELMVVVEGLPNKVVALQFEWMFQHPSASRILAGQIDFPTRPASAYVRLIHLIIAPVKPLP